MMAIIADIHANAPALAAVLAEIDRRGIRSVLCLGDVAGYGPHINECADMLRERDILSLRGNHDAYIIDGVDCPRSFTANRALAYQRDAIRSDVRAWLEQSILAHAEGPYRFVHGGWIDPVDEYLTELSEAYFSRLNGTGFFSGHTHVQGHWTFGNKFYANPGSVGQPRDGDPAAAFAVLENDAVTLHRVSYDVEEFLAACEKAGFDLSRYRHYRGGLRLDGKATTVTVTDPVAERSERRSRA